MYFLSQSAVDYLCFFREISVYSYLFLLSDFGPQGSALDFTTELMSYHVELCPHCPAAGNRAGGRAAVSGQPPSHCLVPDVHRLRLSVGHAGPSTE